MEEIRILKESEKLKTVVSCKLTRPMAERLQQKAVANGDTVSALLRYVVAENLAEKK